MEQLYFPFTRKGALQEYERHMEDHVRRAYQCRPPLKDEKNSYGSFVESWMNSIYSRLFAARYSPHFFGDGTQFVEYDNENIGRQFENLETLLPEN